MLSIQRERIFKNYAFIYSYCSRRIEEGGCNDTGYIKVNDAACYALKKDDAGKVLRQKNCSHCQPWKQKGSKKILAEKLKEILNSPEYIAVPNFPDHNDYYNKLLFNGEAIVLMPTVPLDGTTDKTIFSAKDLESADHEEIIELIKRRNKEKEQIWEEKKRNIEAKLNSCSNLYYYWGNKPNSWHGRDSCWIKSKGMRGYATFSGKLNNRGYGLYIAENHPILDNFSFETGFYLIDTNKPIERNSPHYWSDGGESNPSNFKRYVELGDNVTIVPYGEITSLIHIFQDQNVKQITLTNEKNLVIEYNQKVNNNVISIQQIDNNSELNAFRNYLLKNNKSKLSRRDLDALLNNNSIQWPSSSGENNLGKIVIGIGVVLVVGLFVNLLVKSKRVKKH